MQYKAATDATAPGNHELAAMVVSVFDSAWRAALAVRGT